MKKTIGILLIFMLVAALAGCSVSELWNRLTERNPEFTPPPFPDFSALESVVTREQAEALVLERLELAGVSDEGYNITSYSILLPEHIDNNTWAAAITWYTLLYPADWERKSGSEEIQYVLCYFGETDALTGHLRYAGKKRYQDAQLGADISKDGKEINAHLRGYDSKGMPETEILDTATKEYAEMSGWQGPLSGLWMEYYLPDGNIRMVTYLPDEENQPADREEYHTLDPKTGETSSCLVYWQEDWGRSYGVKNGYAPPRHVLFADSRAEYINPYEYGDLYTLAVENPQDSDKIYLDARTLLRIDR